MNRHSLNQLKSGAAKASAGGARSGEKQSVAPAADVPAASHKADEAEALANSDLYLSPDIETSAMLPAFNRGGAPLFGPHATLRERDYAVAQSVAQRRLLVREKLQNFDGLRRANRPAKEKDEGLGLLALALMTDNASHRHAAAANRAGYNGPWWNRRHQLGREVDKIKDTSVKMKAGAEAEGAVQPKPEAGAVAEKKAEAAPHAAPAAKKGFMRSQLRHHAGTAGFVAGMAGTELLGDAFAGYVEGRLGNALVGGKMGSRADGLASAGSAVAKNAGGAVAGAALNLVPYYTAYQEARAGNYFAAAGWAAVDTAGLAASVLSLGTAAAPVEGGIAALKAGRTAVAVGKAVRAGVGAERLEKAAQVAKTASMAATGAHRVYMGGQFVNYAGQFNDFMNTNEGRRAFDLMKQEALRGGIKPEQLSAQLKQEMQEQGWSPQAAQAVLSRLKEEGAALRPAAKSFTSSLAGAKFFQLAPQPLGSAAAKLKLGDMGQQLRMPGIADNLSPAI